MFRIFVIFTLLVGSIEARKYRLEYGFEMGQKTKYEFSGRHKARMISVENIRTAEEQLQGFFEDEVIEITPQIQAKIKRDFRIASRLHNGQIMNFDGMTDQKISYTYFLDPKKGKVKIQDSTTFNPKDLMEMVIVFPENSVSVGETWEHVYEYNINLNKSKVNVVGMFELIAVQGNIAQIQGKFAAKIPLDKRTDYMGKVSFEITLYFNMRKGLIEKGNFRKLLRYDSRSGVAKLFHKESKAAGKEARLGYTLKMTQSFQRVKDSF